MDLLALFRQHAAEIRLSLRSKGVSSDLAADITQDVFVKLLTGEGRGAGEGRVSGEGRAGISNPRAYLKRIAHNLLIDRHRRERGRVLVDLSPDLLDMLIDEAPDAERIAQGRERLRTVEAALAELPPRTRHAFEQHRMGGRSLAEIAADLDVSTARVWVLVRDAYMHIRHRLEDLPE